MNFKNQNITFLTFVAFVLLLACKQKNTNPNISQFQRELGQENIAMIDLLVEEFEDHLRINYPKLSLSNAYSQFLKDIGDKYTANDSILLTYQSEKTRLLFRNSTLYNELYVKVPLDQKFEGVVELTPLPPYLDDKVTARISDSVIRVNTIGKYMRALFVIKDQDSLVKKYYEVREASGLISNDRFARGILSYSPNFEDYIHKRIVVLENTF